ncbi:MAG: UDP-N-acetylglucosamine--N-acetylmuramyl-(pentapeptide) pyrophosphoryl-undecaprenol N-acetylglucosamine transferase [Erysipelotrichaceae bacterium]|nr:UDP-N-acetylglucosamine--N-acetylmuramyl-(pentapeptide) pyrophosphoryl-undecaprenol N-acetylglucosamine transferase [Erysipelotrichaceae bacterium]
MKITIVAGGSGGHIYPALSLASALQEKGHQVSFIGASDRMEKEVIPAKGYPFTALEVKTTRGGVLQKVISVLSMGSSYFQCKKLLKGQDMVIGFGNYISVPVVLAGRSLKLKTVIHEQNSFVGRANRFLDEKVDLVIGSYEEDKKQFKNRNTVILGNPQSSIAARAKKDPAVLRELGLDPERKTVAIFFGSLGSESLMKTMLEYFRCRKGDYQIVYAAGSKHYPLAKEAEEKDVHIFERVDGLSVMKNADLLISRAGATTLAEVTATGTASILIPSPYVPNNHQYYNARALSDNGAAVLIEEKQLQAEKLSETVYELLNDEEKLNDLRKNAAAMANPHVIEDIVERIEKL